MVKVLIKKIDPSVELPSYKTEGASGMDIMAFLKKPIEIKPKTSSVISSGLLVAFSEDYEIQIRPRSGLAAKNNISVLNTPGTIDSDYRGELKIILYNHGHKDYLLATSPNGKGINLQMIYLNYRKETSKEIDVSLKNLWTNYFKRHWYLRSKKNNSVRSFSNRNGWFRMLSC